MGLVRTAIIRGPAKIVYAAHTFWTPDDIAVEIDDGAESLATSMFGVVDALVTNPKVTVNFTPHSFTAAGNAEPTFAAICAILIPAIFTTGAVGTAALGAAAEVPLVIWGSDGNKLTIANAVITKPPALILSADKPLFGSMTVTGICKTTTSDIDLAVNGALYVLTSGEADPGLQFLGVPSYLQRRYVGNLGTQTGFTALWPEDGWTVDFQPSWRERKVQGLTIDYELAAMEILAKCTPVGPTLLQVADLHAVGGNAATAWGQGARMSGQQTTHSLLLKTGATTVFTLNKPIIRNPGFRFGAESLRIGELGFHSIARFTTGTKAAIATW